MQSLLNNNRYGTESKEHVGMKKKEEAGKEKQVKDSSVLQLQMLNDSGILTDKLNQLKDFNSTNSSFNVAEQNQKLRSNLMSPKSKKEKMNSNLKIIDNNYNTAEKLVVQTSIINNK